MEHVVVQREPQGYWLDATAYQTALPELAKSLPPGASAFALDPGHYDFGSDRCVHDLEFRSLTTANPDGSTSLVFRPNRFKHEYGLTLVFSGTMSIAINREAENAGVEAWLGSLQLDELRPAPEGFVHEFAMTGGSILVTAQDLSATWK